jgi:hypothetical protein
LIIAWFDLPQLPRDEDKIPHLGMPRQANCRMGIFQPIAPTHGAATAVNWLFFSSDFGEDCA